MGMDAFLRLGYHGAGLKAILDQACVPKGSFYNYFESKEDFASAAIHHYADCISALLERALDAHDSPIAGLRAFFQGQAESFEQSGFSGGCLIANLGGELDDSNTCRKALQETSSAYLDALSAVVAAAQAVGEIRSDVAAAELASLLSDAWEGAVIRMKIEQSMAPLDGVLSRILDGFFQP